MNIEEDILKAKYFPKGSRERLRAIMISLLVYLPGIAMSVDLYESIEYEYYIMAAIEFVTMLILYSFFMAFPRYISGDTISHIALGLFSIFLFLSFFIADKDPSLSFFWMATLPIVAFFYLGEIRGIIWTLVITLVFLLLLLLSSLDVTSHLHNNHLLAQVLFGYVSVSYIMYTVEKERNMYEQKLSRSLRNNKLIFRELHHRTKNNLQVILGLLESQTFMVEEPKYKKMFHIHADRIKSMSFVHENLYKGTSEENVNMCKYLGDILDNLRKLTSYTIQMDVKEIFFNVKEGVNIGLVVNEAVTNAIRYANMSEKGVINVSLKCEKEKCVLYIQDTGVGFDIQKEYNTLGMTLMQDLSEELVDGKLEIVIDNGTNIYVNFTQEKIT